MIVGFIDDYEFNVEEFLAGEMRDRDVGDEKSLLTYLCLVV